MNTRDRILDAAKTLFNQSGTSAVSTNHIAEAMGISPGNLYYHFRNKEAIIRGVMERLFAAWDTDLALPPDTPLNLDAVRQLVTINFEIMWDYRFVYRELVMLLNNDPELRERWLVVRKRGFEGFEQVFQVFVMAGVISPDTEPDTVQKLAELVWLISEFWLTSVEVNGKTVDETQMQRGVDLMMQVLQPYIA